MSWQTPDGEGISSPRTEPSTLGEDRRAEAILAMALKKQKWSNRKIARRFGTSHAQIKRMLDRIPAEARLLCG